MRVGAAHDLLNSGHTTLQIMTGGGWKNFEVVARYVEHSSNANQYASGSCLRQYQAPA